MALQKYAALPLPRKLPDGLQWGVYKVLPHGHTGIAFCYNDYTARYLAALLNAAEQSDRKSKLRARRKEGAK